MCTLVGENKTESLIHASTVCDGERGSSLITNLISCQDSKLSSFMELHLDQVHFLMSHGWGQSQSPKESYLLERRPGE